MKRKTQRRTIALRLLLLNWVCLELLCVAVLVQELLVPKGEARFGFVQATEGSLIAIEEASMRFSIDPANPPAKSLYLTYTDSWVILAVSTWVLITSILSVAVILRASRKRNCAGTKSDAYPLTN